MHTPPSGETYRDHIMGLIPSKTCALLRRTPMGGNTALTCLLTRLLRTGTATRAAVQFASLLPAIRPLLTIRGGTSEDSGGRRQSYGRKDVHHSQVCTHGSLGCRCTSLPQ